MGFCLSCGELANTARCPRCKGKVSGSNAAGLSNRDAWSATYLEKQNKKVHAPNLDKLTKSYDATLPSLEVSPTNSEELILGTLSSEPGAMASEISASPVESPVSCFKCFNLIDSENNALSFIGRQYHKDCLSCYVCRKRISESPVQVDGEAHCKQCLNTLGASSTSSPPLLTPDNERAETIESSSTSNSLSLVNGVQPDSCFQSRASDSSSSQTAKMSHITNRLQNMRVKPTTRNSTEVPTQSTPTYSRTFNQLQATVNSKTPATPSIRTRPRKPSESSGGLSFADLLNSRRGPDSRMGTLSRRPVSMMGSELSKRSSLPVTPKDSPAEGMGVANNPIIAHNIGRLARPRPSSINFGNGRFAPELNPDAPSRDAIKRANRVSSFIPQRSFTNPQESEPAPFIPQRTVNDPQDLDSTPLIPQRTFSNPQESEPVPFIPQRTCKTPQDLEPSQLSKTTSSPAPCPDLESPSEQTSSQDPLSSPNSEPLTKDSSTDSFSTPTANSKLKCSKCRLGISDTWFKLPDGRVLHKECFQCYQCQKVIEDGKYSVYDDHEYHTDCLLQLPTSPMSDASLDPEDFCDRCNLVINGPCFTLTNGRQYHPNCFICAGCKKRFEQGTYVSQGDKEYHRECVPKRELIKCGKCTEPIRGVFVTNNNMNFHSECFRCTGCNKVITPSTPFGEVAQQPYCEPCLVQHRTARQSSFAISAARQEQRRSTNPSPSIRP
ncbi:Transforming growth factor beta-1-induced transcript 1 protein [Entomophthora muscae]|uniref:Transforming growth factor beta-1-induced transcript 1 protein n=1 Tax=Entomophthora muscae TaxID=34485 RepID=A0ACC2SJ36_9FUNG|nr:Transforming growth factor beta-1-induced transcript 1 protein [Entomophthora muscae]